MMPRLEAEEALKMAEQVGVGAGAMKRDASSDVQRRWQRAAGKGQRQRTQKATRADLAAMGIGVIS